MENQKFNISIVGYSSVYFRNFIFQFSKLLAKSISISGNINKNGVVLELCHSFLPNSMQVQEGMDYVECDQFLLVDEILTDELLHKMGFRKNLDYIISDSMKEDSDIIFFVVEQSLDSACFINEIYEEFMQYMGSRGCETEQRIIFLNFLDNKFSPEYFLEFQLQIALSNMLKYYIDFDEYDNFFGLNSDMDADINLSKLSNQRLFEMIGMFDGILEIENKKNHIHQIKKNEKMSRRKRKC